MAMLGEVRTEEGTARVAAGREFIRAAECPEPGCAWQRFWSESSSLDGSAAWYRRTAGRTREDWVNPPADSVVSAVVVNAIDDMMHDAWCWGQRGPSTLSIDPNMGHRRISRGSSQVGDEEWHSSVDDGGSWKPACAGTGDSRTK